MRLFVSQFAQKEEGRFLHRKTLDSSGFHAGHPEKGKDPFQRKIAILPRKRSNPGIPSALLKNHFKEGLRLEMRGPRQRKGGNTKERRTVAVDQGVDRERLTQPPCAKKG